MVNKVCYIHTIAKSSVLKEIQLYTCCIMDGPWKHHTKWNKSKTKGQIRYDSTSGGT